MREIVFLGQNNPALKFGMMILLSLICAILIGVYLDQYFMSTPWITLIFIAYAIIGNFIILIRKVNHASK